MMRLQPPVTHRLRLLAAGCLCSGAIAGCGSSSTPPPTKTSGLAAETPQQILKASAAALRSVGSFRMQGAMTQLSTPKQRMQVSLEFYSAHAFLMQMSMKRGSFAMILDGTRAYMNADQKFWASYTHSTVAASLFANRWILVPANGVGSLTSGLHQMQPAQLAACMVTQHGRLSVAGHTTIQGQPAIVLRDNGDFPGDQPETIAIATSGKPYPLRITASGKQRPGGGKGPCGSGSGPSSDGSVTLSGFGRVGKLHVPAHAINLKSLEQHAAQSGTAV